MMLMLPTGRAFYDRLPAVETPTSIPSPLDKDDDEDDVLWDGRPASVGRSSRGM